MTESGVGRICHQVREPSQGDQVVFMLSGDRV